MSQEQPSPSPSPQFDRDTEGHTVVRVELNRHQLSALAEAVEASLPGGELRDRLAAKLRGAGLALNALIELYGRNGRVEPGEG